MTDPDDSWLAQRREVRGTVERDRWGRPKIKGPDGKQRAYTRCTTFIDCLEKRDLLENWKKRQVLVGAALRPDLIQAASTTFDRDELDALAEEALKAAGANDKRDKGTLLHALSEAVDRGEPLPPDTDERDRRDMHAYWNATRGMHFTHIETFTAYDPFKVAGTPDRIVRYQGRNYISDLKTGRVDFGALKIGMQLSVYSRSVFYDHVTGERSDMPDVDQTRGLVIHLAAGSAKVEPLWVDLETGWESVLLAKRVRESRNVGAKQMFSPFLPAVEAVAS
jgi:hypothetical protein